MTSAIQRSSRDAIGRLTVIMTPGSTTAKQCPGTFVQAATRWAIRADRKNVDGVSCTGARSSRAGSERDNPPAGILGDAGPWRRWIVQPATAHVEQRYVADGIELVCEQ